LIDFAYLYRGLCGLARAHRANTMAGHLGAAVVTGYFLGEQHPDLDERVYQAIRRELDRILAGDESLWFDPRKAGVTIAELFEPLPDEAAQPDDLPKIAQALDANIDGLRESGHNVIFASIALRALRDHPRYATPAVVEGVVALIEGFNGAKAGQGYYGKQRGWVVGGDVVLGADDVPPYDDQQVMVGVTIDELIRSAGIRRQGFGGLFHVINHATALTELARFGYQDLARRGLAAHHHHVRLWRSLPDVADELGALKRADQSPLTPEYWQQDQPSQWSAHLTHRIKTIFGFYSLLRFVQDESQRKAAEQQFLYLMA
jgi:hypothetical protein